MKALLWSLVLVVGLALALILGMPALILQTCR